MNVIVLDLAQECVWLESLSHEIWQARAKTMTDGYGMRRVVEGVEFRRKLTPEEFERLKRVGSLFMVVPVNCGFNFGVDLYTASEYPGVPPDHVFRVMGEHLPEGMDDGFNGAWAVLSPLSHNEGNRSLLTFHNFQEPQPKDYYDY